MLGTSGVPHFIIGGTLQVPGAVSGSELLSHIESASQAPQCLCQWYVERANAHDIEGLAEMLAPNVDMFGGPCDHAGLVDFFALYPEVHWEVTSKYEPYESDPSTVAFTYTRTWRDSQNGTCRAVDAAEQISFNQQGQVT